MEVRTCRACSRELTKKPGPGRWPRWCSTGCKSESLRTVREANECPGCREAFLPRRRDQRFCTEQCRHKAWRAANMDSERTRASRQTFRSRAKPKLSACPFCGDAIHSSRRSCREPACVLRYNAARQAQYTHARRMQKQATAERFLPGEVFERDGWVCGICAEPVDPTVAYPGRLSASLDHIVPLSKGGSHTRANAQCAHLGCNSKKGNRVA